MSVQITTYSKPNFLASSRYQNFTEQVSTSVSAGDIFKDATGNAVGIVFDTVIVPAGETRAVAVMRQGWVYADRLNGITDALKTQLAAAGINFRNDNEPNGDGNGQLDTENQD